MSRYLVSIAMTTYNGEKYLHNQIDSIIAQSVTDWELVICDDVSTDDTWQILREYTESDGRIKIFKNQQNLGFKKNFEKAIGLCKGKYIALSDQDDVWAENHLKTLLENIGNNVMVCSNVQLMTDDGRLIHQNMKSESLWISRDPDFQFFQLLHSNYVQGCTTLFKSQLRNLLIPIPDSQDYHDYWFAFRAVLEGSVLYLPDVLVYYRQHPQNVTGNHKKTLRTELSKSFSMPNAQSFRWKLKNTEIFSSLPLSSQKQKLLVETQKYFQRIVENKQLYRSIPYFFKYYCFIYRTKNISLFVPRFLKRFILPFFRRKPCLK